MTPLLHHFLKLPATTSLVKIEQRKEAQKIQEVYYVTEKVSHTEEVWEHEEVVEERAKVSYEDKVAPLDETVVLLPEVDVFSSTEKANQRAKNSELRGEISVTDTAKRKETRSTEQKVVPKTPESVVVVVEESESENTQEVTTLRDKPTKEKTEGTIESPTEAITDERRGSISVISPLPDKKVSKHETSVSVKRERETTIKTESKGRQVREQEVRKAEETVQERELVKDISLVTDTDETKPFPIISSTEARKQTEKVELERKVSSEESINQDVKEIPAIPEETVIGTKEFTVKDKTKVFPTQEKIIDEDAIRKQETQIKPPVITGSKKDKTAAQRKVSVKDHEVAEKSTSDDTTDTEKPKPKVEVTPKVKPKESVTDIESESVAAKSEGLHKKREESKYVPPPSVPSKPAEKTRTSPQKASRGTESKAKFTIISSLTFSWRL